MFNSPIKGHFSLALANLPNDPDSRIKTAIRKHSVTKLMGLMMNSKTKKLPLSVKIAGLCGLFVVPIAVLMYQLSSAYNKDIEFAEQEKKGTALLLSLVPILDKSYEWRSTQLFQTEGPNREQRLTKYSTDIDAMFSQLARVFSEVEADLKFGAEELKQRNRTGADAPTITQNWAAFKAQPTDENWSVFITNLKNMITHVGDTSNLILDPDLDSYYLMDSVLVAVPMFIDRLFTTAAYKKTGDSSRSEFEVASVGASIMRDVDLERIKADILTAISEDGNFYGTNEILQSAIPKLSEQFVNTANQSIDLMLRSKDSTVSGKLSNQFREELTQLNYATAEAGMMLWAQAMKVMDQLLDARIASYRSQQIKSTVFSIIALLILMVLGFAILRQITGELNSVIEKITNQSVSVNAAGKKLQSASSSLSTATTQQAAAIDEVVSSIEEISSMLGKTTENASMTRDQASSGKELSEQGRNAVNSLLHAMNSMREVSNSLGHMSGAINEVAAKTKIINDIVFETKILSFNASIEAARAGAHGRGFSVVADEVSKLASMSGRAAEDIRNLLDRSTGLVNDVVQQTIAKVDAGLRATEQCSEIFSRTDESIHHIVDSASSIERAAKEQELGVKQTNQAMGEMDQLTQRNSRAAIDLSSDADELNRGAIELNSAVDELRQIVKGKGWRKAA
jgi:methyl-accepting chemotaxis protein